MNEQKMLEVLTKNNIPAVISHYENGVEDGEVTIVGTQLAVQVGSMSGFILTKALYENPNRPDSLTGVSYYNITSNNLARLISTIKELRHG